MKQLLFALVFISLLCAMSLELEEKALGTVGYTVQESGAYNNSLILVVLQGDTQYSVQETPDFNGFYKGTFHVIEPGTYTVRVVNPDTGASAEAKITLASQEHAAEIAQVTQNIKEEQTEAAQTIALPEDQTSWFPYLIVGVFLLIIVILLFANPLKKTQKKTQKKR